MDWITICCMNCLHGLWLVKNALTDTCDMRSSLPPQINAHCVVQLALGAVMIFTAFTAWSEEDGRSYLGQQVCVSCHQSEFKHWSHTVHNRAFANSSDALASKGCEACHGAGSAHLEDTRDKSKIVAFTHGSGYTIQQQNDVCFQCHQGGDRIHWYGSMHEASEVACSDCHNPMSNYSSTGLLRAKSVSETCFHCHQQQRIEFHKKSHMPLVEGKISCIDCHNPHGSANQALLKQDHVNKVCYQCHAEKRGPFIWEHAPVRDSCLNCHQPHGSNHEYLLVSARPFLCQQCHTNRGHPNDLLTPGNLAGRQKPDARIMNRSCQNCHAQIHGSNHPAGVRFHR